MKKQSFLSRLFRPEAKGLADPSSEMLALFGLLPTQTGVQISAHTALMVTAVGSAIKVISEAAACLDLSVRLVAQDGTESPVSGHPVAGLLRGQVNDWTSGFELIRDLMIDALSDDRGGVVWANKINGKVVELIRYRSGVVQIDLDQDTGQPFFKIKDQRVDGSEMIHLRAPLGRSPLSLAREAIGVAYVLQRHAANLFSKGARPSGALSIPKDLGEKALIALKAAWAATHEADGDSGKTAFLYDGVSFVPFTFTSTDAQFLENRKFQIAEIARAFRVPPSMLFDLDRATWGNTEQLGKEFLTYCLEPWLKALEGALGRVLFTAAEIASGHVIRFDRDDMTRADLQTRATTINSLIAAKVINRNEGRSWIGLGPVPGGEVFENPNITTDAKNPAVDPKGGGNATE